MSATEPRYGLTAAVSDEEPVRPRRSSLIPVLVLFVGLAIVTIWFVARPALGNTSPAARLCERVVVDESGSATCVTHR